MHFCTSLVCLFLLGSNTQYFLSKLLHFGSVSHYLCKRYGKNWVIIFRIFFIPLRHFFHIDFRFRFKGFISRSETCSPAKGTKFNIQILRGQMKPEQPIPASLLLIRFHLSWEQICPVQKKWQESHRFWSVHIYRCKKTVLKQKRN